MNKLYCPKCKEQKNRIEEKYIEPIIEKRQWNGYNYSLISSNLTSVEFEQLCPDCGTKLKNYIPEDEEDD